MATSKDDEQNLLRIENGIWAAKRKNPGNAILIDMEWMAEQLRKAWHEIKVLEGGKQ